MAPASRVVRPPVPLGPRRVRGTIRRLDPWSVLKVSLLFYLSVVLVFVFAAMMLFFAADAMGIVGRLESFVQGVGWPDWEVRALTLFRWLVLLGVANVVVWAAVNLIMAFLYNLVSDVVGGIEVTMSQRDLG